MRAELKSEKPPHQAWSSEARQEGPFDSITVGPANRNLAQDKPVRLKPLCSDVVRTRQQNTSVHGRCQA
jgi:hypothetical protein